MRKRFVVIALIIGSFVCSGHLLSFASDPVSGVAVTVIKGDKVYDTTTGEDGRFRLSKLPIGKYTVSFAIIPNVVSMELKSDGKDNVSIFSPVPETGGVDTHIEFTSFNPRSRAGSDPFREPVSIPFISFNPRSRAGSDLTIHKAQESS